MSVEKPKCTELWATVNFKQPCFLSRSGEGFFKSLFFSDCVKCLNSVGGRWVMNVRKVEDAG